MKDVGRTGWRMGGTFLIAALSWAGIVRGEPVGRPGLQATYSLDAKLTERPEHERKHRLSVVSLILTVGDSENMEGKRYQWFELAFSRLNGDTYHLWLLMDGLPSKSRRPAVVRYVWWEPIWEKPLEYIDARTGRALLPRMGLWRYGWPKGLENSLYQVDNFPKSVTYLGYPFRLDRVSEGATVNVPEAKPLRLNPDLIIYTLDSWRYLPLHQDSIPKSKWYVEENYAMLTTGDLREMMAVGQNLFSSHHAWRSWRGKRYGQILDVWQEPVFVFDHPYITGRYRYYESKSHRYVWPEPVYRSNFYGQQHHMDEPGVRFSGETRRMSPEIISTCTPRQLAGKFQSKVASLVNTWVGYGFWRTLTKQYGVGSLPRYRQPVGSWDVPFGTVWYTLAAGAAGYTREKGGLGVPSDLARVNMEYGSQIPMTPRNIFALNTAILRGPARSFGRAWGISIYDPNHLVMDAAGIEYAYCHGATHFWFWGGWPGVDVDWPHAYKLYLMNQVRTVSKGIGFRDVPNLARQAKTAIALPYGYDMDPTGYGFMFRTAWMHAERKNARGIRIRRVLRSAYIEAERMLRDGVEFDVVIDDKHFAKDGYDEIVYVQEDGSIRIRRGTTETVRDGPRVPIRPNLGKPPSIALRIVRTPQRTGQAAILEAERIIGSGRFVGPMRWMAYLPDGFARRPRRSELEVADRTERWRLTETKVPGKYRVRVATIDEFSRSAEAWVEFEVKPAFMETPAATFPDKWKFKLDPQNVGQEQKWFAADLDETEWADIKVPAWWEQAGYDGYNGLAWYRCPFDVSPSAKSKTLILAFAAVDGDATVYLNGKRIGVHAGDNATGWDKPFEFDVSNKLRYGSRNQLTVRVLDTRALGGIFKPVRLIIRKSAEEK